MLLLNDIMATFTMPCNEPVFRDLPEEWHESVRVWHKEHQAITAMECSGQ